MITRLNHVTLPVLDHATALDFYVGKLGFEVRTDRVRRRRPLADRRPQDAAGL